MMHSSLIHESSSDAEGNHVDNKNLDSDEQQPEDISQDGSDNDNDSLYNRCWQRAKRCVEDYIREKDATANDKANQSPTRATSSRRGRIDVHKSKEDSFENYQKLSSRKGDCTDRSDTELSQMSQTSSDESKTYSEVYSEIFEESKAREKKAEKIRRVYNSINNTNRTRNWVEQIDQSDIDEYTTDASERSDKESEENFQQSENENDYEMLIKEQLDVIAKYRNDPFGNFRNCIEEYMYKIEKARLEKETQAVKSQQLEKKTEENLTTDRSNHSNVISIKSHSQDLDFETKSYSRDSEVKCFIDNVRYTNSTEILHFEHCEIYHVKRSDKRDTKDQKSEKFDSSDSENFFTDKITSNRSKRSITKDNQESSNSDDYEQRKEKSSEHYSKQIENQKSQSADETSDNSYLSEVKSSEDDWSSQTECAELSESSGKKSSECESENYKPFNYIALKKLLGNRLKVNRSERASNNSHKTQHFPTTSSQSSKIRNSYNDSTDSTNYYNSSPSQKSSKRSRKSRSGLITPKTFEDRACSPIKIKSGRQFNKTISKQVETDEETDEIEDDKEEIAGSISSTSTKIISEDIGLQYPSENELEESIKSSGRDKKRRYDLDKALLEIPSDLNGNAIMFDNDDELLDISLSDDEMQMQQKLQEAASSDDKKDVSSRNSSYNSIPSADRSSIFSMSSYEPSVRFYRRTHAEDDDDGDDNDNLLDDDSEPMTYKKHVSRLAERALRTCTNYYNEGIKLKPQLDQELNDKVQMLYDSEMRFNTAKRQKTTDDLLKEFNERLQRQLKSIASSLQ